MRTDVKLAAPLLAAAALCTAPAAWAADDEFNSDEDGQSAVRDVRFGLGAMAIQDVEGVAPSLDVGIDWAPWGDHVGLRLTVETAMRVGWGMAALAPELTVHPMGRSHRISPFLNAGLQLAVLNLTDSARGVTPELATSGLTGGLRRTAQAAGSINDNGEPTGVEPAPPVPVPFAASLGPQATAGVAFGLGSMNMELGARWSMLRWTGGTWYSSFSVMVSYVGFNR
jgi:hypothetical protein